MRGQAVVDEQAELVSAVDAAVCEAFRDLRRTIQKNLALLTVAFLRVVGAARSGHGGLSLAALFRVLPSAGSAHSREKRLHRFLGNHRLDPRGVTEGLARLILGKRGPGLWPIVFDQTKAGSTQALVAGVPFEGRTLPLAVYSFEYPWKELAAKSQNWLEEVFLADLEEALPAGAKAVFIGDRGYARASLLRRSARLGRLYLIRGRSGTRVVVSRTRLVERDAVPEMKEDPSASAFRSRRQTTVSCCCTMAVVVNVTEKAWLDHVMCGPERRTQVNHRQGLESYLHGIKTGVPTRVREEHGGNLVTGHAVSGV